MYSRLFQPSRQQLPKLAPFVAQIGIAFAELTFNQKTPPTEPLKPGYKRK